MQFCLTSSSILYFASCFLLCILLLLSLALVLLYLEAKVHFMAIFFKDIETERWFLIMIFEHLYNLMGPRVYDLTCTRLYVSFPFSVHINRASWDLISSFWSTPMLRTVTVNNSQIKILQPEIFNQTFQFAKKPGRCHYTTVWLVRIYITSLGGGGKSWRRAGYYDYY